MSQKTCELCLMPLGKNLENAGTEKNGQKSNQYCQYCCQNGVFVHNTNNLQEFQKTCYDAMRKNGKSFFTAKLFSWMIRFAPYWQKR